MEDKYRFDNKEKKYKITINRIKNYIVYICVYIYVCVVYICMVYIYMCVFVLSCV